MSAQMRHLGDPTWYRIAYSIAVRTLDATGDGPRTMAGGKRPAQRGPKAAEERADELLTVIRQQLHGAGWVEVGRRPGWRTRRKLRSRRRASRDSEIRDERVATFLDQTVEPATMALWWSARVMQGEALDFLRDEAPRRMRRRRCVGESDREGYLLQLLSRGPRDSWLRRALARVGVMEAPARTVSYRVRYSLSCLLARTALAESRQRQRPDPQSETLALAVDQLKMCFEGVDGSARDLLARRAWEDPGLTGLRELAPEVFEAIVGPRPEVAESRQEGPEPPEGSPPRGSHGPQGRDPKGPQSKPPSEGPSPEESRPEVTRLLGRLLSSLLTRRAERAEPEEEQEREPVSA